MSDPPLQAPRRTLAILDTNVIVDIHSCHDVMVTFEKSFAERGDAALDEPENVYRRARSREAIILAMLLHDERAHTFGLHNEMVKTLERVATPAEPGTSYSSDFTTESIWFVRDRLLRKWNHKVPKEPGTLAKTPADDALIACARKCRLPLITSEGYLADGSFDPDPKKIRAKGAAAGVQICTPREYFTDKISEGKAVETFLERFAVEAPLYIADRKRKFGNDDAGDKLLAIMRGHYRHVLRGEVNGKIGRVRIRT